MEKTNNGEAKALLLERFLDGDMMNANIGDVNVHVKMESFIKTLDELQVNW